MSILGSTLGRALSGGGAAVASLAAKYVDEDLMQQRMQAQAELQRMTAKAIREDDDAFRNDPTRIARDRQTRKDDALAAASTAREAELAGLNDTALQGAREAQKDRDAKGDTRRKVEARKTELEELAPVENKAAADRATAEGTARAELQKKYGNDPLFLQAMRKEAQAKHIESSASVAQAELTRMRIADEKRLGELYERLLSLPDGPESSKDRKTLEREIAVIKGRNGAPDKGEKGPTVEEEIEYGPDGKAISRKVKTKGPAGLNAESKTDDPRRVALDGIAAGKGAEVVKRMESQGLNPGQIVNIIGEDEYKKIKGTGNAVARSPIMERADQAMTIERMDERTLRRLAAIDGHVHQQEARRELKRREDEREPVDTSGIGFGGHMM